MTRQNAREIIMQILYQLDVNNEFDIDEQGKYLENLDMGKQEEYCRNLLSLV